MIEKRGMVTPNYYRVGGQHRVEKLQPILDEIKAQQHWEQVTDWDSTVGSAPAVVTRDKFITDTGSSYADIFVRDLWVDLGDGIKHKIVAVHNDTKIELENYVDRVPGTIDITFWEPIRVTVYLEGDNYFDGIHFTDSEEGMCISFVGDGGSRITNSRENSIPSEFDPASFAISDQYSQGHGTFLYGSVTFDDIVMDNRNHGISVYEPLLIKGYLIDTVVIGRVHSYFFDFTLESIYKHTGISHYHGGTQIQMCCYLRSAEQTIESIATERALTMECICDSVKSFDGHYICGEVLSVRWENSATDTFKGGALIIGNYMGAVNCQNDAWETSFGMGNIGLFFGSSEFDSARTDPDVDVISMGNLFRCEMANNTQYGQGIRVSNYNPVGNTNMKIISHHDSFWAIGDLTNYHDAYGDRGDVDLYYPYKNPVTGVVNGGTVTLVKT